MHFFVNSTEGYGTVGPLNQDEINNSGVVSSGPWVAAIWRINSIKAIPLTLYGKAAGNSHSPRVLWDSNTCLYKGSKMCRPSPRGHCLQSDRCSVVFPSSHRLSFRATTLHFFSRCHVCLFLYLEEKPPALAKHILGTLVQRGNEKWEGKWIHFEWMAVFSWCVGRFTPALKGYFLSLCKKTKDP